MATIKRIKLNPDSENFSAQITEREFDGKSKELRSKPADPIKDHCDIARVKQYILYERKYRKEEQRLRDYLLFILGINIGLRAGDLRELKIGDVLDEDGYLKHDLILQEEKTSKIRKVHLNSQAREAIKLYLGNRMFSLNDPLFYNCSNNNSEKYIERMSEKEEGICGKYKRKSSTSEGIRTDSISRILKTIAKELGLQEHCSSHMLRKTFAYHMTVDAKDRNRGLEITQEALGHSSQRITLRYIGLAGKEIDDAYEELNLGSDENMKQSEDTIKMDDRKVNAG